MSCSQIAPSFFQAVATEDYNEWMTFACVHMHKANIIKISKVLVIVPFTVRMIPENVFNAPSADTPARERATKEPRDKEKE